ncbi:MAG: glycosyltransferase [Candidatus Krumholzibacteriia bacterium]
MTLVSVVVLTYDRRDAVLTLLDELVRLRDPAREVIVVDNGSADGTSDAIASRHPSVQLVALPANRGVGARNRGLERARGDIVVTLDDDMVEFTDANLAVLREVFTADPRLGAVNFKVTWPGTDRVRDWVHRPPAGEADRAFPTYEITEGAVAWRRAALDEVGLYREDFFISHEGLDLSLRLLDRGWHVRYDGRLRVGHAHAAGGRKSWRRYYYDTRNLLWIATLHLPWRDAVPYLARGLGAMLVYSIRDRFLGTWVRAVRDGLLGLGPYRRERRPISAATRRYLRECDRRRPGFWTLVLKRLRQKDFSLE